MATTGDTFGHQALSGCDTGAGMNYAHEQIGFADTGAAAGGGAGGGVCTTYSIQGVAGIGTAGCAIAGLDYGRRP